jgi:glyoxylase-like metal-dependent hydrolase (beta-lactamase superfamily II)
MKIASAVAVTLLALLAVAAAPGLAQTKSGVEKLYIINCGEGVAGNVALWSPGVNVGKPQDFADSCYLIKHAQGWFLWDTGVTDAIAAMPQGQPPSNPGATHWYRPVTLAGELDKLGVKPADIKYVAISHTHPDHIGNIELFPQTMLLVQKAEYEWPSPFGPRFKAEHPATKLEGDRDVFGDGTVVILSTPGHTPGHQSLLVKVPKTGALVLSGDAVHFRDNFEARRVPSMNVDAEKTQASMQKIAGIMQKEQAQLWINHDKAQRDGLKLAPEFYE